MGRYTLGTGPLKWPLETLPSEPCDFLSYTAIPIPLLNGQRAFLPTSQCHGSRALGRFTVTSADQTLIYAAIGPGDGHQPEDVSLGSARHHSAVFVPRDRVRPVVRRRRHAPELGLSVQADRGRRRTDLYGKMKNSIEKKN